MLRYGFIRYCISVCVSADLYPDSMYGPERGKRLGVVHNWDIHLTLGRPDGTGPPEKHSYISMSAFFKDQCIFKPLFKM